MKTYTPEELKVILDSHAKWLRGCEGGAFADFREANLCRVDLRGADLREADFRGACLHWADFRGAKLNWKSHDLIAEILRRAAGEDVEKRMVAGLILVSRDWCWDKFAQIEHPQRQWAINELAKWVEDGDDTPKIIREAQKQAAIIGHDS